LFEQSLEGYSLELELGEIPMGDDKNNNRTDAIITTFEFPLSDIRGEAPMKNIPLSTLPYFQGLTVETIDFYI